MKCLSKATALFLAFVMLFGLVPAHAAEFRDEQAEVQATDPAEEPPQGEEEDQTSHLPETDGQPSTLSTTAPELSMTLRAASVSATPGSEVKVSLDIEENPGIASLKIGVGYDSSVLTLKAVEYSAEMAGTQPGSLDLNPVPLLWVLGTSNFTQPTARFAALTFTVSDTAPNGTVVPITITYDEDETTQADNSAPEGVWPVALNAIDGSIRIIDGMAGDITGDGKVNARDVVRLLQYLASWNVEVDRGALDVNNDGKVNTRDAVRLLQHISQWPVEIFYPGVLAPSSCDHDLEAVAARAATCTVNGNIAYWRCTKCGRLFDSSSASAEITLADTVIEAAHTVVIDPAVPATPTSGGLTQGSHCSVCGTVLVPQEPITGNYYTITYNVAGNDTYLQSLAIENTNPQVYTPDDAFMLADLWVDGYIFEGWYDGAGSSANQVRQISRGTTGNKVLYARWTVESTYKVNFVSEGAPIEVSYQGKNTSSITMPTNMTLYLPEPEMQGYVFLGWSYVEKSEEPGKPDQLHIVKSIKPGSKGEITLQANWTSKRNMTVPVSRLDRPMVYEDTKNGVILFTYKIGEIKNVPLNTVETFLNVGGLEWEKTTTVTKAISENTAKNIAETISHSTTDSSAWTLSSDWNEGATYDREHSTGVSEENAQKIVDRVERGENWNISTTNGGSSSYTKNSGSSSDTSSTNTSGKIYGVTSGGGGSTSTGTSGEFNIGAEASYSLEESVKATASVEVPGAKASAEAGVTEKQEIGMHTDYTQSWHTDTERNWNNEVSANTSSGTENMNSTKEYTDVSESTQTMWNTTEGYQKSQTVSNDKEVSKAISQMVNDRYGYSSTTSRGGSDSATTGQEKSQMDSREYSTTVEYTIETEETESRTIRSSNAAPGHYRLVNAGTVGVFAVVGYDVATNSYFTYTYNVIDKDTYLYIDYSKDDPNFKDRENGVLPFAVPYEVNEIVSGIIAKTDDLEVDAETGIITGYYGTAENVIVPDYISVKNGDGTYRAIQVKGIASAAFQGNANLSIVRLGRYVTDIPDNAFKGCTSLKTVIAPSVSNIGANAFSGCTQLDAFKVSRNVKALGTGAFKGVSEISVYAGSAEVARAAVEAGAKRISLYMADCADSLENAKLELPEETGYFALHGSGRSFRNVWIKSDAAETVVTRAVFQNQGGIALELSSPRVTLEEVTVTTDSLAMLLRANSTELSLKGKSGMTSTAKTTAITRSLNLVRLPSNTTTNLTVKELTAICGGISGQQNLLLTTQKYISEEEYQKAITSHDVNFNANGGTVELETKRVSFGQPYGELPVPTRQYYSFAGWFTAADGGAKITSDTVSESLDTVTLYAHWTQNQYAVYFDANGGLVEEASRQVDCGTAVGTLPTPTRDGYTFKGWFTAAESGEAVSEALSRSGPEDVTIYAQWEVNRYKVTWSVPANGTITVRRTASPVGNAGTGALSSGAAVYYNDQLTVTYGARTGYSVSANGQTSVTVTGDVSSSAIYVTVKANSYTYNIYYRSSNGTDLGSTTRTEAYGTSTTIYAPGKSGYNTPGSQYVTWDSVSAKNIYFYYSPSGVGYTYKSGQLTSNPVMTYSAELQYANRTATSVQVRVLFTETIAANGWNAYAQMFRASSGNASTGNVQIVRQGAWSTSGSVRTSTGTSGWITVPVGTTGATSVPVAVYWYQANYNGTDMSYSGTGNMSATWYVSIPAY